MVSKSAHLPPDHEDGSNPLFDRVGAVCDAKAREAREGQSPSRATCERSGPVDSLRTGAHFDGPDYSPALDHARLTGQIQRVYECVSDGQWRTLAEIGEATGDPHASVSAQLRHLRKDKFGAHTIEKRRRQGGLWEYRMGSER